MKDKQLETEDTWSAKPLHRAQRLSDFIGQDTVIDIIQGQLKSGKLSKSYLITGEMGDGKSSLGRILAKKINNTKEDNHPNIRLFKATVQSGIDEVRALLDSLKYSPIRQGKVVIIIEECFPANTKIMLEDGTTETIENIAKNPEKYRVLTFNEITREIESKPVLKGIKKKTKKMIEITLKDGSKQKVTPSHKFWSVDRNDWIEAKNLTEGETLFALKPISTGE